MTSCLAFVLVIAYELGYDRGFADPDELYRVACMSTFGEVPSQLARCPGPIEPALKESFPEVTAATALIGHPDILIQTDKANLVLEHTYHATQTFFDVFDYPVRAGDAATALREPGSVVLTFETAMRIFGDVDVVGRQIAFGDSDTYNVTAVLGADAPRSHLEFNALTYTREAQLTIWTGFKALTYFRMVSGSSPESLTRRLNDYIDEHATFFGRSVGDIVDVFLQPVPDIYLTSELEGEAGSNGSIRTLGVLGIAALLILLMAVLNYINLSTARYASRGREVGVRMVLGAQRDQVARQFLSESMLLAVLAAPFSVGLLLWIRPAIGRLTGVDPVLDSLAISILTAGTIGTCLIVGFGAGAYPAFVLARADPLRSIRGKQIVGTSGSGLRSILIALQLFVTLVFVLTTAVAYFQLRYTANRDLGYNPDNILYARVWGEIDVLRYQTLREDLESISGVQEITYGELPGTNTGGLHTTDPSGQPYLVHRFTVGPGYASTLGMDLIEGEAFQNVPRVLENGMLLNEAAVRVLGLTEPIGEPMRPDGSDRTVIGVLRDFNYFSLHQPIPPVFINPTKTVGPYILMRLDDVHASDVRSKLAAFWQRLLPGHAFTPGVLSDRLSESYVYERRLARLMGVFSSVALLVAFLGLFAMVSYAINARRQEIAIRRLLGASVRRLAWRLSSPSIALFAVASTFALGIVAIIAPWWLADFAYRTTLDPLRLGYVLAAVLIITLIPVLYHVSRAVLSPPAFALRDQ